MFPQEIVSLYELGFLPNGTSARLFGEAPSPPMGHTPIRLKGSFSNSFSRTFSGGFQHTFALWKILNYHHWDRRPWVSNGTNWGVYTYRQIYRKCLMSLCFSLTLKKKKKKRWSCCQSLNFILYQPIFTIPMYKPVHNNHMFHIGSKNCLKYLPRLPKW